jgi:hypothetical protein
VPHRADRRQTFRTTIADEPVTDDGMSEAALGGGLAGAAIGVVGLGSAAAFGAINGIPAGVAGMFAGAVAGLILGAPGGALLAVGMQHVLQLAFSRTSRKAIACNLPECDLPGLKDALAPFGPDEVPRSFLVPEPTMALDP